MVVECTNCAATVKGEFLGSYEAFGEGYGPPERFSFLKCPNCQRPLLIEETDYGFGWTESVRLYPPSDTVHKGLPSSILNAYQEARRCFNAKAFTAAAIMCRKTLEGICSEHGIKAGTLAGGLREMRDKEVIEGRLFQWAEALRLFGNDAAHQIDLEISAEDARDIVEFTHALLEYVFTFRDRFAAFMERRGGEVT